MGRIRYKEYDWLTHTCWWFMYVWIITCWWFMWLSIKDIRLMNPNILFFLVTTNVIEHQDWSDQDSIKDKKIRIQTIWDQDISNVSRLDRSRFDPKNLENRWKVVKNRFFVIFREYVWVLKYAKSRVVDYYLCILEEKGQKWKILEKSMYSSLQLDELVLSRQ